MIKKIIFVLVLLCISKALYAIDDRILLIKVEGTQRVDVETVISYSKIKIGDT